MIWQEKAFTDLGYLARGRSRHRPRNDDSLYGGIYPFVQTADIKSANFYLKKYSQTYNEKGLRQSKIWPKDTLCITIAANIAETAILGIDACFPDSIIGFIPHEGIADVRFIKYFFDIFKERMQRIAVGAAQDNLSMEKLLSFKVPAPAYHIQKRLADILSAYDDLIENNLRRIQLLEEMARAQFMRITKDVKETKPLSNFASMVKRGISPKYVEKEGITVLNQKCIRTLSIDFSQSRLTDQSKKISPERMLQKFDTVVNSTGTGTLGRVSLHLHEDFPSTVDSHVTIVRAKEEVPRLFLAMAILVQQDVISMMGEGATNQTELSAKRLSEELTIPVISTTHMLEYHNVIVKQLDLIWNLQKQIVLLKQARNILLPRLMSGEIDVSFISIPEAPITEPLEAV